MAPLLPMKPTMDRVKLIWDFRGPNASHIAVHHAKHLKEFADSEEIKNYISGNEQLTDMHYIAFLVVEKHLMNDLRERLKPNRGQQYS